jgi:hypothetical protein
VRSLRRYESGQIEIPVWLIRRLQPIPLKKGGPVDFDTYEEQGRRIKDGMRRSRELNQRRLNERLQSRFPQVKW